MIDISTAPIWGISDTQFLVVYGALCLAAAVTIGWQWHSALGPKERSSDPLPDLSLYKLAMLGGGPQLAITTAAAKLHRDGLLTSTPDGALTVAGELAPGADRLERELFETVDRNPGIDVTAMRVELTDSEPLQWMTRDLTSAGLLLEESRVAQLSRLWLAGGLLALLGGGWFVAGWLDDATFLPLAVLVFAVGSATSRLRRLTPRATNRGREILGRRREERDDLRRHPVSGEMVRATALFGGGALWLADPALASGLGVPREDARSSGGSSGGCGGCSTGDGGSTGCASGGGGGGGGGCGGGGCGGGG